MKKILSYILIITLLMSTISIASDIDVLEDAITAKLDQGETTTQDFNVQNNGVNPVTLTFSHDLDLKDSSGDEIILTFSDPGEIQSGDTATVTMTFDADSDMDYETYLGTVTVTDSESAVDTFSLTIIVEPNVCRFGEIGSDLEVTIEDPDTDDQFKPGDTMSIRVNVENKGSDDIKVQVHAYLFSEKTEVTDIAAPTNNIENGEDEDFKFSMEIPFDSRKIDEDESYFLLVKAIDDDNEADNCITDRVEVDVDLDSKDIVVDEDHTYFFPGSAMCGDNVVANVQLVNIGSRDNDRVQVFLTNTELGIDISSLVFSIDAFSAEEDNTKPVQLDVSIPETAEMKDYKFQVKVKHDGGTETTTMNLPVSSCESISALVQQGAPVASIEVVEEHLYANQGSFVNIPLKITNDFGTRTTYFITLTNIDELGESTLKSITLGPHQESTVFMEMNIKEDAPEGTHSAVIEVRAGSTLVRTETVPITITEAQVKPKTVEDIVSSIPTILWVIVDALVLILMLLLIILVARKIKHKHS